ncbi:PREDICTED: uncharacterized protein LOC109590401 [Amphimedon queenslandica]|uniref:Death domain-containing protein n=1 Tax=Amphimedon queenslandica TaxID=400682 RepID=A0AAN0JXG3_AMPQE|nr:PREDICTED: uncharacterized protein LOC109590401 [Amphimedon queenslandica]|eukprot:XP_019861886.1 PREDICTED: uncharacterized protein LOC109590401 [Amphimedon queenslandica]
MLVLSVLSQAMFGPVHWIDLGLSLGLHMPSLDEIRTTRGDATDCLKQTLQKWLEGRDNVTGTTWDNLIKAVRNTGDRAAAERIPGILKSRGEYPAMTGKFHSLLLDAVKEALTTKSIDDVKGCLLDLEAAAADWASEVDAVTDETSLEELLQRYCFLSNLSLLKCIAEKLDLKESKSRIDQLAEERDAFYSKVLAGDFADAKMVDHEIIKEHHVEMTVVVSWPSSETTLARFQDFITEEFKDLSMFIALRAVHHSSLTPLYTVPIWALGRIRSAIASGFGYFRGILQVILNNEVIYEVKSFHEDLVKDIEILLMPATTSEEGPVVDYLKKSPEKVIETSIDGLRIYIGNYGKSKVIVVMTAPDKSRQGPIHAAAITSKMLEKIPSIKYVVAVGVCFGMDPGKQKLGDIIISGTICDFTNKREGVGQNEYQRGPEHQVNRTIVDKFRHTHGFEMPDNIKVTIGVLISTCSLIDNPDVKQELLAQKPGAIAGEMEGAGIMAAIDYAPERGVSAIVIKGIGDWGDGDKEATKDSKATAARNAARYVYAALNEWKLE